jgi:RNA polymerase sigma-70 factor (ECF subfamily)
MSTRGDGTEPDPFAAFYAAHYRPIAAYIRRRVPEDTAQDVLAQVFTLAWRRFDHVPPPPGDRLWLFGVARHTVADQQRSARRRLRLQARLAREAAVAPWAGPDTDPRYELVTAAIAALRPKDREALLLVLWDGLSHAEAAAVLNCTPNALELRYRRARNAIRDDVLAASPARRPAAAPLIRTTTTSRTDPS